ncbi:thiamine/thiamine pyrophosphate ABC transporter permease ThiP [Candidatus Profftia tarda]|uniref:Thiamine transport system permease protein ThiP n=1 Tax=Candidatus Profftia tarda TaxID=1177216 RepID=A0A8E4GHY4_9ENTR|nr:thiamine/thiamine pyrophosphate ABC transporter permease ThiP [Candidatus Profftia tarda]CAD6511728.1 Thiamine transport system permease protein ThiP [Candidatus Profftia tarda]
MANLCKPLIPLWLIPGLVATITIIVVATSVFISLWTHAPQLELYSMWQDDYLWSVVRFTFWQAFLSAVSSVSPALLLARALFYRRFIGRQLFLQLFAMTIVLPILVAIFGILKVYGKQGWLAQIYGLFGIHYTFSLYGLQGILLAHIFFNMPLATHLLLQALEEIPTEQQQLAAHLRMNNWQKFIVVEWPYLKRQFLSAGVLIFMLCFSSFAIALSLGGGPQATTISLAIYQALSYDYDLGRAAFLSMLQIFSCFSLVLCIKKISGILPISHTQHIKWRNTITGLPSLFCDMLIIFCALLLILPPLIAVVIDGVNQSVPDTLIHPILWQAILTSLKISVCSGVLAVFLTMMLLWTSRELYLRQLGWVGQKIEITGMMILGIPSIILATGFFVMLTDTIGIPQSAYGVVILINALMAIPYTLTVLENPMRDLAQRYNPICLSLRIHGFNRLRIIELKLLARPLYQAMAFSCVLSMGDFGVIALFGNEKFLTLPLYLYEQIGAYRTQDGSVTALLLLILCFLLFTLLQLLSGRDRL